VGLDWLNFFAANVQTGFGAFISVYLTASHWTQTEIGIVLSVGTFAAMISQLPAGAVVDALSDKRAGAAAALAAIFASALMFAFLPWRLPIMAAEVLHGFASCMLTPAIAAITLTLARTREIGARLGRNARWGSIGSGCAAAIMGAAGFYLGSRVVFLLTAALAVPAVVALAQIRPSLPRGEAHPAAAAAGRRGSLLRLLADRRLLALAGISALFQLGNAAMLPIAAGEVTKRAGTEASLVIAACIVLPQFAVACFSPWFGQAADRFGRRRLLMLGLAAVPLRGLLFALTPNPYLIVVIQALDGISGAAVGVLAPLISADITHGTGRFNLTMGAIGLTSGLGATVSTTLAGAAADTYGVPASFLVLAASGAAAVLALILVLPETKPD